MSQPERLLISLLLRLTVSLCGPPRSFRLVPFLTELRAVMDWVWTDTTLSLSSWICVEDVYAHCFVLKCWKESEKVGTPAESGRGWRWVGVVDDEWAWLMVVAIAGWLWLMKSGRDWWLVGVTGGEWLVVSGRGGGWAAVVGAG